MWLPLIIGGALQAPTSPNRVYVRGETLALEAPGATAATVVGTPLTASINGSKLTLPTAALRPGSYTLEFSGGQVRRLNFEVAPAPAAGRYPLWRWGGTAPKSFGYYRDRGFTSVGSPMITGVLDGNEKTVRDIQLSLDEAARQGLDYSIYLNPLYDPKWKSAPGSLAERFDGSKMTQAYPRNPAVIDHAKSVARRTADLFGDYPAWRQSLLGSEFQLDYNFATDAAALGRTEANIDVRSAGIYRQPKENLPINGVIEDTNPRYRFLTWWFHRGMGDAALNEAMSILLRARKNDLVTWHDPYRLAPVSGSARGLGAVSTWTYAQPDMTRLYSTRILQAAARIDRQRAMQTITLFLYPRFVESIGNDAGSLENDRPGGNNYYTAGPDFARQALWLVFSQRPDIMGIYFGGALQPDAPNVDARRASPDTFDAIGEVSRRLIAPYGPTVLAGTPLKPKVALLMSAAAIWLGESPKNVGYPTEQFLPYASLLAMNHIPFDVVLDEDVTAGRLSGYEVLVMPQAGALTRSMVSQIQRFTAGGGRVIADASLKADIGAVTKTNFDFSFQSRVDGVAAAKGEAITADENRRRMEGYAADLGKLLRVERFAWADSPRALVNTVDAGDLKLVFAVNDNRDFGPRFGAAKLHMEKGVLLPTRLSIAGKGVVYDTETGARLDSPIAATLPAAEGKLYAVLPELGPVLAVLPPASFEPGRPSPITGTVKFPSGKAPRGAYPLWIEVTDPSGVNREFTRAITAKDGAFSLPFVPAVNDPAGTWKVEVTDLVTRKKVSATFNR